MYSNEELSADVLAAIKKEMPRIYKLRNWGDALIVALRPHFPGKSDQAIWERVYFTAANHIVIYTCGLPKEKPSLVVLT